MDVLRGEESRLLGQLHGRQAPRSLQRHTAIFTSPARHKTYKLTYIHSEQAIAHGFQMGPIQFEAQDIFPKEALENLHKRHA